MQVFRHFGTGFVFMNEATALLVFTVKAVKTAYICSDSIPAVMRYINGHISYNSSICLFNIMCLYIVITSKQNYHSCC